MPEALTTILPILQIGATGGGAVGNLISGIQRGQEIDALRKQQKIASNPAEVSKMVAAATKPLDQGLVEAVTNATQGAAAERGLATSPGLFSGMLAQNLAPYEQQNQSLALNQVLTQLGIPAEYGRVILGGSGSTSLTPAFASLMKMFQPKVTGAPESVPNDPTVTNLLQQFSAPPASGGFDFGTFTDSPVFNYGGAAA
jgi:hypothetical protein